jgi:predicted GH43/DUF377 family glycosyl hydrolase
MAPKIVSCTTRREFVLGCAGAIALGRSSPSQAVSRTSTDVAPFRTPFKYGKLVVAASDDPASFDSVLVDCPLPFSVSGKLYMTYIGFDGIGYQSGLAKSDDLIHWHKLGLIMRRDPGSKYRKTSIALMSILKADDSITSLAPLRKIDGRYLGTWHAYPGTGYEEGAAVIGLAWSKDLMHWDIEDPILFPQDGGAWERGGLYKSYLVKVADTYYLFYSGKNKTTADSSGTWVEQTGLATSSDLKTWTRYDGNPILPNGTAGSRDEIMATQPTVVRSGDTWGMYYQGVSAKWVARELLAVSHDLKHFTKVNEVMIDVGPPGSVDSLYAHKSSQITWHGDLYSFYCAVSKPHDAQSSGSEVRGIAVARSRPW